jgi:ubiquinone/menaquinone biosynthesis C-methylase UbiE
MKIEKDVKNSYNGFAEEWAEIMRSGGNTAHRFLEKPSMYSKLPDLNGKSVLCVGCGSGEECEHLKQLGAKRVVGIDISEGLIKIAKSSFKDIEFYKMPIDKLNFKDSSFDLVYSSLTLHYVDDWKRAFSLIYKVLKKRGIFLFSTHHPTIYGAYRKRGKGSIKLLGYVKYKGKYRIFGDYFKKRVVKDVWFGKMRVSFYNRPLTDMIKDILQSKFEILEIDEPKPVIQAKRSDPVFYSIHSKIPTFIIFKLRKN